jgi:hypothetical protein
MRINMESNPLKYALESLNYALGPLKYAAICTINPKYASISNNLKLGF